MNSKNEEIEEKPPRDYLRICCYVIAVLELFHSLMFAFTAIYELSLYQNTYNVLAYLSSVVYVLTVKALVVGLWKEIPKLIIFWLLYATLATATSTVLLIWNILVSPVFDKVNSIQWAIVYLGIIYECTCLCLVFRHYRNLCPYSLLEGSNFGCPENETMKEEEYEESEEEEIGMHLADKKEEKRGPP